MFSIKLRIFSHLSYVLGAQKNFLVGTAIFSTHSICFGREIRKLLFLIQTLYLEVQE